MLIVLWTNHELSYDDFHENKGELYHFYRSWINNDGERIKGITTPPAFAYQYKDYFSEVEAIIRTERLVDYYLDNQEQNLKTKKGLAVDMNFLEHFHFPLLLGKKEQVFQGQKNIVLTQSVAQKLFENENPIGRTVRIHFEEAYTVSGVIEDLPKNTSLDFEFLIPITQPLISDNWSRNHYSVYVLVKDAKAVPEIESAYAKFLMHKNPRRNTEEFKQWAEERELRAELIPIGEDPFTFRDKSGLYTFLLIGFLIIIIAVVNFINLSTAQSSLRIKEIGLRKVHGGEGAHFRVQFLTESIAIACISGVVSLIFIEIVRPFFNELVGIDLKIYTIDNLSFWGFFIVAIIVIGFLSGLYPTFYLSRLEAVKTLRGEALSSNGKPVFRNALVVFQFSVAIGMSIATAVIFNQLLFLENSETGLSGEHSIHIEFQNNKESEKFDLVKSELEKISGVVTVSGISNKPFHSFSTQSFSTDKQMSEQRGSFAPRYWYADPDISQLFNLKIIKGRDFDSSLSNDKRACLVNETFVKDRGWKLQDAIGKKLYRMNDYANEYEVVGVMKDFNYKSLAIEMEELIIMPHAEEEAGYKYVVAKLETENVGLTLKKIESLWKGIFPNTAFDASFMEEELAQLYQKEQTYFKLFVSFSCLSITIALLGLFSLSGFKAQRKTKEMGVRKVYGAEAFDILKVMTEEFTRMILIASVIAVPIAYYMLSEWLEGFAYHVDFNFWFIPMAIGLGLLTSWLTVFYHSMKVVRQDPVKALRYE